MLSVITLRFVCMVENPVIFRVPCLRLLASPLRRFLKIIKSFKQVGRLKSNQRNQSCGISLFFLCDLCDFSAVPAFRFVSIKFVLKRASQAKWQTDERISKALALKPTSPRPRSPPSSANTRVKWLFAIFFLPYTSPARL